MTAIERLREHFKGDIRDYGGTGLAYKYLVIDPVNRLYYLGASCVKRNSGSIQRSHLPYAVQEFLKREGVEPRDSRYALVLTRRVTKNEVKSILLGYTDFMDIGSLNSNNYREKKELYSWIYSYTHVPTGIQLTGSRIELENDPNCNLHIRNAYYNLRLKVKRRCPEHFPQLSKRIPVFNINDWESQQLTMVPAETARGIVCSMNQQLYPEAFEILGKLR